MELNLKLIGDKDGETVTATVLGLEVKMEFAQWARIFEYIELFHESFTKYRATRCKVCGRPGPLIDGECPDCH